MPNTPAFAEHYQACRKHAALCARSDRGVIEVRGADRATWLNNLVTNVITTLSAGEGNYAFVTNVKGRTVFDLNMLVFEDRLWLDVDRRWIANAAQFLERYHITEDVEISDISDTLQRVAVVGPRFHELAEKLAVANLAPLAWLQHVTSRVDESEVTVIRNDFCGISGCEFVFPAGAVVSQTITNAAESLGFSMVGPEVLEVVRIESGVPSSVDDIDEEVVPPETLQVERGISYHKGCYLGQEVIERMRAHGVLARKLVGMRFEGDTPLPAKTPVMIEGKEVGRAMSGCYSEQLQSVLHLGYIKTASASAGTEIQSADRKGTIVDLPL